VEKGRREQEGIKGRRRGTRFRDRAMLRKGTSDRTFILAFGCRGVYSNVEVRERNTRSTSTFGGTLVASYLAFV